MSYDICETKREREYEPHSMRGGAAKNEQNLHSYQQMHIKQPIGINFI